MIINEQDNNSPVKPSEVSRRNRRKAKPTSKIVKNSACPECRAKGGDSTGNHLMVFEEGNGYCSKCPRSFTKEEVDSSQSSSPKPSRRYQRQTSNYKPELTIEDMQHMGYHEDKNRGITAATYEHFGIKTEINTTNRKQVARYYPAYAGDEIYGYATRILPKKFSKDIGVTEGTDVFGWNLCKGVKRTLIIVEGQEDVAACYQLWDAMNKRSTDRRYRRASKHIIGIKGSKGCKKTLMHHLEDLKKYTKIIWMGDNYKIDSEGAAALEIAIRILGEQRVHVAEFPDNKKDLCDILKDGGDESVDLFSNMFWEAKPYEPADIIQGEDVTLADIEKEQIVGLPLPFESLDDQIKGMRLYEHTLIVSGSGMGKTSACRAIAHAMSTEHGWRVGNVYLEEKNEKTQQGYMAYDNNVALDIYREDFSCIPLDKKEKTLKNVINNMTFLKHNGGIQVEVLLDKFRHLMNSGCKLIIFDHISLATAGSDNERTDIDKLMEAIYKFCEHNPIHIVSVVHLNKGPSGSRDVTRGGEITPKHLLGSSGLMQMVWNLITVEGDNQHPEFKNRRYLRVLKTREGGNVGHCKGAYDYSPLTGRFTYDPTAQRSEIDEQQVSYSNNMPTMGNFNNGAS